MHYTSFRVRNFRGIRDTKLDLSANRAQGRIATLVGLNESGKTTVLEAIDRFLPTQDGDSSEVRPNDLTGWVEPDINSLVPISERSNFNGEIAISARVRLEADDIPYLRRRVRERTGFRVQSFREEIEVTVAHSFENSRFTGTSTRWSSVLGGGYKATGRVLRDLSSQGERASWQAAISAIRSRLPRIWYFPNFLFEFPQTITLTASADETSTNRFYRQLFQDILDALGRDLRVDDHVVSRALSREVSDVQNLRQVLLEVSREVTESVVASWSRLFDFGNDLRGKRVVVDLVDPQRLEPGEVAVEFLLEDTDGVFGIHERSLGFRWFFVYLLLTHYRGRRRSGESDMLFLFDEPASNLHPAAQAALLDSLGKLSEHANVIFTTHSHHLINPAWLSSAFVVVNDGLDPREISSSVSARRTDVQVVPLQHFASQHPNRTHYFQPILDVLEYRPSALEHVPSVVMTEGKTDYYALRYFSEVIKGESPSVGPGLLPGTGAGSLLPVIQMYVAWSRPFLVLLDSDSAGVRAREKYRQNLGSVVDDALVELGGMCGDASVTAIESIFTPADQLIVQRAVDPSSSRFSKKVFGRGIQYLYATRTAVGLSDETVRRLDLTLESLRERLAARSGEREGGRASLSPDAG